jgi:nucleotide-binding universal stress UspA family protein
MFIPTIRGKSPAHSIAEVADEAGADVIIVGAGGHSPAALGSVAHKLLNVAKRPVLVISSETTPAEATAGEAASATA